MKTQLNDLAATITDTEVLRPLVVRCLAAAPEAFWTAAASSTGKYHPSYALGEGGLIRHTRAVFEVVEYLLHAEGDALTAKQADRLRAAALLHDVLKQQDGQQHTSFTHPLQAAELLRVQAREMPEEVRAQAVGEAAAVAAIVAAHHGRWNTNEKYNKGVRLPLPTAPEQKILHYADFLASRKDILVGMPERVYPGEFCTIPKGTAVKHAFFPGGFFSEVDMENGRCERVWMDGDGELMARVEYGSEVYDVPVCVVRTSGRAVM